MRIKRTAILAGAAALLAAGAAQARPAEVRHTNVALPDGSVMRIEYPGDVAPVVRIVPAEARALSAFGPFAELERIAALMDARREAMLRQIAALQEAAARAAATPAGITLAGDLPPGVHYTYFSSTTDANGCTRTVEYRSDGSGTAPQVTRASAGACETMPQDGEPILASTPAAPAVSGSEV
jgi:hypothetical protein